MLEVFLRSVQTEFGFEPVAFPVPEESLAFSRWRMNEVRRVISADIPYTRQITRSFIKGDHWQGGWGYVGPMVDVGDPNYRRIWEGILRMFTSRNVLNEVKNTHVNGVLGRPMRWSLVPIRATADERDDTDEALKLLIAEASVLVQHWLRAKKAHRIMRQFLTDLLIPPGRAMLRLFLPRGGGVPIADGSRVLSLRRGNDFSQALSNIFIERPDVDRGRVYTDPDTMRDIAVSLFRARSSGSSQFQDAASLSFLNGTGDLTMVGTIYEDGGKTAVGYPLGGRLTAYQAEREPLITEQLLQQQRLLNYAESTIGRNLTTSGFLDRVLVEAQLNGKWVTDENGDEHYEVNEADVPRFGPGEVTVLNPQVYEDEDGKITLTRPRMDRGQPIDPKGSIASSKHFYDNMRREVGQAHLVAGEENDSTIIQYGLSLLESGVECINAFSWMIETALAWAEALQGEPGKYTSKLRAQASCFLNVGPVTPEQRAALTAAFEKSLLSRETAQELMGVADVDEENDRIAAQPGAAIDLKIRQANSFKMLTDAGLPARIAAIQSGYSEEEADEMQAEADKKAARDQELAMQQLKTQAALRPQGQPSQGSAGLRSKRQGRPSGTAERNPGQQQNKGARALQNKKNNRRPV